MISRLAKLYAPHLTFLFSPVTAAYLLVVLSALCLSCGGSNPNKPNDAGIDASTDGPPLSGECGLEGERVWCMSDSDCAYYYGLVACDDYGYCHDSRENEYLCDSPGQPCGYLGVPNGYTCGHEGICTTPCLTHDDCPGGECICSGFSACRWLYCYRGTCGDNATEVPGTRACNVKPEYLQGDCHGINSTCDASYIPVGEYGCLLP